MTEQEKSQAIGNLVNSLKKAKAEADCIQLKGDQIAEKLKVLCQVLESREVLCRAAGDGFQLRKCPATNRSELGFTVLGEHIELPETAEIVALIQKKNDALVRLWELQAKWDEVKP